MSGRSRSPAVSPAVKGKVTQISVTYTVNTESGPWRTFHGLAAMHKQASPERVRELLDNLTVICEELLAARGPTVLGVPATAVRVPFPQTANIRNFRSR
jgi:hypothetical protein